MLRTRSKFYPGPDHDRDGPCNGISDLEQPMLFGDGDSQRTFLGLPIGRHRRTDSRYAKPTATERSDVVLTFRFVFVSSVCCLLLLLGAFPPVWFPRLRKPYPESDLSLTKHTTDSHVPTSEKTVRRPRGFSSALISSGFPRVDRSVMEKLQQLGFINEDETALLLPVDPNSFGPSPWPPLISALPYSRQDKSNDTKSYLAIYDRVFCGTHPCKLLLPTFIGGNSNGTDIQMRIQEVIHLAKELNRTLVLPNVSNGVAGTCNKFSFATYYDVRDLLRREDVNSLEEDVPGLRAVTLTAFTEWVKSRPVAPRGTFITVDMNQEGFDSSQWTGNKSCLSVSYDHGMSKKGFHKDCLASKASKLHFRDSTPLRISTSAFSETCGPTSVEKLILDSISPAGFNQSVLDASNGTIDYSYVREDTDKTPDVIGLEWDMNPGIKPVSFEPSPTLDNSPRIRRLSKLIYSKLTARFESKSLVVIDWQYVVSSNQTVSDCASSLLRNHLNVTSLGKNDTAEDPAFTWDDILFWFNIDSNVNGEPDSGDEITTHWEEMNDKLAELDEDVTYPRLHSRDPSDVRNIQAAMAFLSSLGTVSPKVLYSRKMKDIFQIVDLESGSNYSHSGITSDVLNDAGVLEILRALLMEEADAVLKEGDGCSRCARLIVSLMLQSEARHRVNYTVNGHPFDR